MSESNKPKYNKLHAILLLLIISSPVIVWYISADLSSPSKADFIVVVEYSTGWNGIIRPCSEESFDEWRMNPVEIMEKGLPFTSQKEYEFKNLYSISVDISKTDPYDEGLLRVIIKRRIDDHELYETIKNVTIDDLPPILFAHGRYYVYANVKTKK